MRRTDVVLCLCVCVFSCTDDGVSVCVRAGTRWALGQDRFLALSSSRYVTSSPVQ